MHDVLRSGGRALDRTTRDFMEPRFHHDFSAVRVHTDAGAAASAQAVNAAAYTVGRHIVLSSGHDLASPASRRILAHELAHVVQHGKGDAGGTAGASIQVGDAADPAEAEADARAAAALARDPVRDPKMARANRVLPTEAASVMRRKVLNHVVTDFQTGAQACVVHVHGEERTALAVAKEIRSRRCVNLMHLDTTERMIQFTFSAGGFPFTGKADPNRILTAAGRKGPEAIESMTPDPGRPGSDKVPAAVVRATAEDELRNFAESQLLPQLNACRAPVPKGGGPLPVVASHNNEGLRPSTKVASTKRSPNPAAPDPKNPGDFLLVTDPSDFDAFKGTRNVVLQENPVQSKNDDGSMSVLLAGERYTNVEKEGRQHDKLVGAGTGIAVHDGVYVKDYAMVTQVLNQYGVSEFPCASSPDHEARSRSLFNRRLGTSGRVPTKLPGAKPVLDPDPLPGNPPPGCRFFRGQPDLDRAADDWRSQLEGIPLANLVHWVLGGGKFAPAGALKEFDAQKRCMITAMWARLKSESLTVPPGDIVLSEQRSFAAQNAIWQKKMSFTTPAPFDRISDFARMKCDPDLGTDQKWDPGNARHAACWKTKLSGDERQKEILMASSAPGISRHHAGVDFDFGKNESHLDPKAWTGSGDFADSSRWLARNASAYGFIQPFDRQGGYGTGYMPEPWHWSYFPVAQAALEFVMDHEQEVEKALDTLWSDGKGGVKPEFSFIRANWKSYLFNVEDTGAF